MPDTFHARFPVSVKSLIKSDPREKFFSTLRPSADEAPRHMRENTSGTQGISMCFHKTVHNKRCLDKIVGQIENDLGSLRARFC